MNKYDKYKDSGFDWIGEIPEHWEFEKLGWQGDFTASGIDKKTVKGEPLVKMINYTDVYGNEQLVLTSDKKYMVVSCSEGKKEKHQVNVGDLIFTPSSETIDEIGLSALVIDELPDTVYSYHVIRLKFDKYFDVAFRKYLCNNNFVLNQFSKEARGTTRQIICRDVFKNIGVVIPPKPEQTAIADYLTRKTAEIDSLIAKKEKLLQLYEEEKTAIINQAVTKGINPDAAMKDSGIDWLGEIPEHWEVKKLKYIVDLVTENSDEDLKKVGLENIESNSGNFIETNSEFQGDGIRFRVGDILYGKLRPYLAKVLCCRFEGTAVGDFFVLRAKENYLSEFIKYRLLSTSFTQILNSSTYGAKMPRVNWKFMAHLFFSIPKKPEQTAITQHIETETARIDAKFKKTQKLINLLKEYKQALISEVVTGKVKVI